MKIKMYPEMYSENPENSVESKSRKGGKVGIEKII
jgi:hypothetical protein